MSRTSHRLSQKFVASIGEVEKDTFFWDSDLKGFFVRAWPGSRPVWGIRFKVDSKVRTVNIGPCHEVKAEAARTRATEIKQGARLGTDVLEERATKRNAPTIADLAVEHQLVHRFPAISEDTFKDRKTHWDRHIVPKLGKIRVKDLSRADVIKWYLSFEKQPSLANRVLATLGKALNDCTTWEPKWRTDNPSARMKKFEEKKRQTILSMEQISRVLYRLRSLRHNRGPGWACGWLYHALLISGLRLSELSMRKWTDFDSVMKTLYIAKTKSGKERTVNLSDHMVEILNTMPRENEWMFPSSRGEPFKCPQHLWQKIRKDLGLGKVRLHDLRHTCASYSMHHGGLSQREVMELLGHSQMSTTERYLNVHDEQKQGISERASKTIHSFETMH